MHFTNYIEMINDFLIGLNLYLINFGNLMNMIIYY